ncbi:hypothetical protein FC70_GL001111 [Paucilactobacillus oligofermentans DSM 15707 = LMG 22743]|uniref:Uncharacterized protein n=1 Tax=Paucilactobacillus oligofermentans DSM 15707 = LMG 22743 TaxID=1423778 RepID=A0A0R1RGL1_9LACO|nr:hypothetical protein [Paucilactobacillus oligofermentans]KRL55513.1 hypothetical protein FC70_GL001111 [Paucilactobacillus oligofermentans DSM 15707 = LMG 22743]CUS25501.1 Uncharacterized protein LACOL_0193 [Paucilactobacillus oligofermentans DSM 15707 = LMG 22743]
MTYEYFDDKGSELVYGNFINAVRDIKVYRIIVTNAIVSNTYFRSGAGWERMDSKEEINDEI